MINGNKVVVFIPAGRRRYMEILLKHILRQDDLIDEIRLWVNTKDEADLEWMNKISLSNKKITLDKTVLDNPTPDLTDPNFELCRFWENCKDENTLYIRFDDDVVWLEDNFFKNLIEFRLNNPEPLFVYPNIINNSIVDHIHQRLGCFPLEDKIQYECFDGNGTCNGEHVQRRHLEFIEDIKNNNLQKYKFTKWNLFNNERISINSLAFFGKDIKNLQVTADEENYIACVAPSILQKPSMIYGGALLVHFSFHTQRDYLDTTDVLQRYAELLESNVEK
jgi:hypothetical protein